MLANAPRLKYGSCTTSGPARGPSSRIASRNASRSAPTQSGRRTCVASGVAPSPQCTIERGNLAEIVKPSGVFSRQPRTSARPGTR